MPERDRETIENNINDIQHKRTGDYYTEEYDVIAAELLLDIREHLKQHTVLLESMDNYLKKIKKFTKSIDEKTPEL